MERNEEEHTRVRQLQLARARTVFRFLMLVQAIEQKQKLMNMNAPQEPVCVNQD